MKVLEKAKLYETKVISNLLNIHGNDVVTVMKYLHVGPWMWLFDYRIDIKNTNHAIVTYRTCNTLFSLEKEGKGREKEQCSTGCLNVHNLITRHFNPNIKVTPLKLPPRERNNDVCCQWEFKLEKQ